MPLDSENNLLNVADQIQPNEISMVEERNI